MLAKEYILDALTREGITHIFMVPGGLIDPFLPALAAHPEIKPVVAAQEGGAAYMADGYSRAGGRFGVCLCIGGPGVTNTITPLAAAYTDHSPVLLISGEVPTCWEGRGGFQDASAAGMNDIEILRPITSLELSAENPKLVAPHLQRALTRMLTVPQSPVHLALPQNIQRADIPDCYTPIHPSIYQPRFVDTHAAEQFWDIISGHTNITILAGAGVEKSNAHEQLIRFAETYAIPVATTLRAKGVFPEDHPLSLGVFGYGGTRHAIDAITDGENQVLLVLGSALSQRDTLFWSRKFMPTAALIHVDADASVMGRTYSPALPVIGDCCAFLEQLLHASDDRTRDLKSTLEKRMNRLGDIRSRGPRLFDAENMTSSATPIHPARVVHDLRAVAPRDAILFIDSGAHRAFAAHYWEAYAPRQYLSATNIGPMGWAIPAGVGGSMVHPDVPSIVLTGDGCMMMHGLEIQTAARYNAKVIFVVINNSALGNVYLRARNYGPEAAELVKCPQHNWALFAEALGVKGLRVTNPEKLTEAFQQAFAADGPVLIDIICDRECATPVTPYSQAKEDWLEP
jgi:acetolactate synthase-1/2/3 large subunit